MLPADNYAVASGLPIYGGRAAGGGGGAGEMPAWRTAIPDGHFADISLNMVGDIRPAGWPSSVAAGTALNWAGAYKAVSFSALGGYGMSGSGHVEHFSALWAGNNIFDLSTLMWVGRNIPTTPLLEPNATLETDGTLVGYNLYYERDVATGGGIGDFHAYQAHPYGAQEYISTARGGGPQGSMRRYGIGGGIAPNCIHEWDLSLLSGAPARVVDSMIFAGNNKGSYLMTADDPERGGAWVLGYGGEGPLKFVADDGTVTEHPLAGFAVYGNQNMVKLPIANGDCLVCFGQDVNSQNGDGSPNPAGLIMHVRVIRIVSDIAQAPVKVTWTGTQPTDTRCGGDWCGKYGFIGSMVGGRSKVLYKLVPPAPANVTTEPWTWLTETLQGMGGSGHEISNPGLNPNTGYTLDYTNNGMWGRAKWFDSVECFIFNNGEYSPTQALVPTGI
jgi:hypothetical protein